MRQPVPRYMPHTPSLPLPYLVRYTPLLRLPFPPPGPWPPGGLSAHTVEANGSECRYLPACAFLPVSWVSVSVGCEARGKERERGERKKKSRYPVPGQTTNTSPVPYPPVPRAAHLGLSKQVYRYRTAQHHSGQQARSRRARQVLSMTGQYSVQRAAKQSTQVR